MNFLSQSWWQGVAGVAQIFAAGLSIIAIGQASKSIRLARQTMEDSTAPYWEFISVERYNVEKRQLIWFFNGGFGTAANLNLSFLSFQGDNPAHVVLGGTRAGCSMVPQGETFYAELIWSSPQKNIAGELTISCKGRHKPCCTKFNVLINEGSKAIVTRIAEK